MTKNRPTSQLKTPINHEQPTVILHLPYLSTKIIIQAKSAEKQYKQKNNRNQDWTEIN